MTFRALRSTLAGVFAICLLANLFAAPEQTRQLTIRQQHILRAINLTRSGISQPALQPFSASSKTMTTNSNGAITGMLTGLQDPLFRPYMRSAVVVAWTADSTRGGVGFATVFPDGSYRIDGLPDGNYYVLAGADDYLPKFYDDATRFIDATPVLVINGGNADGIDFAMERIPPGTGAIFGTAVDDRGGTPMANVSVNAFSPHNPFQFGFAQTDRDGSFRITELRGGEYVLTTYFEGYLAEFYDDAESLSEATLLKVEEPGATGPLEISLGRGGMISGSATDEDGAPLANVYVEAMSKTWFDPEGPDSSFADGWGAAVTDDSGKYLIGGLPSGEYLVRAQSQNSWWHEEKWYDDVRSPDEATPVMVRRNEESTDIDFTFPDSASGTIAGQVTATDVHPLHNVEILAFLASAGRRGTGEFIASAITDSDGNYILHHLPEGSYFVQASLASGWEFVQRWWPDSETRDSAELVVVDGATDPAPTDFRLPVTAATAAISGTVHQASGEILPDAWIEISSAEAPTDGAARAVWAYANSDSTGHYIVENLPAGRYVAQAQFWQRENLGQQWYDHVDRRQEAAIIELTDGDRREDINFALDIRPYFGSIAGAVEDNATGEPMARAYVELTRLDVRLMDGPLYPWPFYAVTSDSGTYRIDGLPQGEYFVAVYANGAFEYFEDALTVENAIPVAVTGGEVTHVDFGLSRRHDGPGSISGQVYDEYHDGLLETAVATARPVAQPAGLPHSEMVYTAVINQDGRYAITGLPTGEYYVMAFSPVHIGEYFDSVFDPAEATPVLVDSLHPATDINFSLMPALLEAADGLRASRATISGHVLDIEQRGLGDATVYMLNERGQPVTYARTRSDGKYELRNVPTGTYRLRAGHPDYASRYQDGATTFEAASSIQVSGGDVEIDFSLLSKATTRVEPKPMAPNSVRLLGNFPNPFNPTTRISFSLPAEMNVNVTIFNLLGRKVRQLYHGRLKAGLHNFNWDGRNQQGERVTSGIYFTVLQTRDNQPMVKQMTLMK